MTRKIFKKRALAAFALILVAVLALAMLIRPLHSQNIRPPTMAKQHFSPAIVECHIAYRSQDLLPWQTRTLMLKPRQWTVAENHENIATYRDLSVHCSYIVSTDESPTVDVSVFDTHTGKPVASTMYDFSGEGLKNQFGSHGFTGLCYFHHPTKPALVTIWCTAH